MDERFVVFDVETPNASNSRMSAIGVCVVENRQIVQRLETYIDPETHFDPFNIHLTGITPEAVIGKPNFAQLWPLLQPIFDRGILVAHNAVFDLGVLSKCLRSYGIQWKPRALYVCTVRMSRALFPQLPNHRLSTVSDYFGLSLDHHRAGSDAEACAGILLRCLEQGCCSGFIRTYTFDRERLKGASSC